MLSAVALMRTMDNYLGSITGKLSQHKTSIVTGISGVSGSLLMGSTNWTAAYSPTDISSAGAGIITAFAILLDMLTGMGNWYVTNAMGQLYIAMACLMFVFILIKSLFRHSGGKRR